MTGLASGHMASPLIAAGQAGAAGKQPGRYGGKRPGRSARSVEGCRDVERSSCEVSTQSSCSCLQNRKGKLGTFDNKNI